MMKKLEREVWDSVSLKERNCSSACSLTGGHGWKCYGKPLVYVSVNVMSLQDHGSRRTARIKGGRDGNWYIAERVLVGQRTFSRVDAGGYCALQ